jgi:subtilisin family serine protease
LDTRLDVDTIYEWRNNYSAPLSVAAPAIGAPATWAQGYNGSGIKVAIIDPTGIDFTHPDLNSRFGGYYDSNNINIGDGHATLCAGVVASQNTINRGIAPGAILLSGNTGQYGDDRFVNATEWAIYAGVNIIVPEVAVGTQGQVQFLDRYYDHIALTQFKSIIVPAGNMSQSGQYVTSPGLGYNILV